MQAGSVYVERAVSTHWARPAARDDGVIDGWDVSEVGERDDRLKVVQVRTDPHPTIPSSHVTSRPGIFASWELCMALMAAWVEHCVPEHSFHSGN